MKGTQDNHLSRMIHNNVQIPKTRMKTTAWIFSNNAGNKLKNQICSSVTFAQFITFTCRERTTISGSCKRFPNSFMEASHIVMSFTTMFLPMFPSFHYSYQILPHSSLFLLAMLPDSDENRWTQKQFNETTIFNNAFQETLKGVQLPCLGQDTDPNIKEQEQSKAERKGPKSRNIYQFLFFIGTKKIKDAFK